MVQKTMLASHIDAAGSKTNLDTACKQLLANKLILAWIMKYTMEEYQEYSVQEIAANYIEGYPVIAQISVHSDEQENKTLKATVSNTPAQIESPDYRSIHGTSTEDATITEGTVTFDIRFQAVVPQSGEYVTLIINVEAQNDFYPGYPLITRGIYYCCRLVSAQYGTEFQDSHYENIKKVYSIWICINPPKSRQNTITKYEIAERNMVGDAKEVLKNYDLLAAVMICLKAPSEVGDSEKGIIDLLTVLLSSEITTESKKDILEKNYGIAMKKELEEVSGMCNYSDYVYSSGENAMAKLVNRLLSDNRIEDIRLATSDKDARKRFYDEYGIPHP